MVNKRAFGHAERSYVASELNSHEIECLNSIYSMVSYDFRHIQLKMQFLNPSTPHLHHPGAALHQHNHKE
jgi:hypothetical protein